MLKTTTNAARENVRRYIMEHFDASGYTDNPPEDWPGIARFIMDCFHDEKCKHDNRYNAGRISKHDLFFDWCQGLPSVLDTCYYYNRSAVDDLGLILEETPEEKARFSESQAEKQLTHIIYMELQRGCK